MKKIILTLFALLTITFIIKAQQQVNRCGTTEYTDRMKANDPSMQQRMNEIEHNLEVWMANHPTYNMKYIITIPVVVHVVYNTAAQNISDDQIRSQIDVLNEDYNRRNADTIHTPDCFKPLAGSMPINFCLASRDPQGNWTNGIVRVQTNVPCFSDDAVKYDTAGGSNIWDPNTYCNIWVCNECGDVLG
ncbi:MAG: zinc metalloprotease, partial [Bacteroidota bacterium]